MKINRGKSHRVANASQPMLPLDFAINDQPQVGVVTSGLDNEFNSNADGAYPVTSSNRLCVFLVPELWGDSEMKRECSYREALIDSILYRIVLQMEVPEIDALPESDTVLVREIAAAVRFWLSTGLLEMATDEAMAAQRRFKTRLEQTQGTCTNEAGRVIDAYWIDFVPFAREHRESFAPKSVLNATHARKQVLADAMYGRVASEEAEEKFKNISDELDDILRAEFPSKFIVRETLHDLTSQRQSIAESAFKTASLSGEEIRKIVLFMRERTGRFHIENGWLAWLKESYPAQHAKYHAWIAEHPGKVQIEDDYAVKVIPWQSSVI